MSKRCLATVVATLGASLMMLSALPTVAPAAESPWWQVLTGSRPTNMWKATDNVQKIEVELEEPNPEFFPGLKMAAARIDVGGEPVGCLATSDFLAAGLCEFTYGFPVTETAAQLEAILEAPLGPAVEVTGGPVGSEPFVVTVPSSGAPSIGFFQTEAFPFPAGNFNATVLSEGGSGRLVFTLTNLGDAPVDATTTPLTIVDELPEGIEATGVEAFAGAQDTAGGQATPSTPVECEIESTDEVVCTYEGELPPYEAIEVEILASLTGEPPAAGAPGRVTVSGGDAPTASALQVVKVSPAETPFGIDHFSAQAEEEGGGPAYRAGSHPFQLATTIQLNAGRATLGSKKVVGFHDLTVEQPAMPRNLRFPLPAGLVGNASAMPQCDLGTFFNISEFINACPDESAIGVVSVTVIESNALGLIRLAVPLFNLPPADGQPARFGFVAAGQAVVIDTEVRPDDKYRVVAEVRNVTQAATFLSSTTVFWGTPGDPRHDSSRGWNCVYNLAELGPCERPSNLDETAFLRQPVSCDGPLDFDMELEPWNVSIGSIVERSSFASSALSSCHKIPFTPTIAASPTSRMAANPSGLSFHLNMPNVGLLNKDGIAEGQAKKVEVDLPQGMTINPSQAEGLVGCSPGQYANETVDSKPGEGCPEASKIGTVQIATPLLEEEAKGSVYVASPYDNPFGSLLALYMVAKIPERGILIKQAGKVETDPVTGQITTTFDDLPQLPFSSFNLEFRPGGRAPLVTPSACGSYDVVARFTPWSAQDPNNPAPNEIVTRTSTFTVDRGVDGGACPSGTPPFKPGFTAGTGNNAAGTYAPFLARLTRNDGEQEFSRFSMKLPKGVIGKLAGIPFCSEAAIAAARARTGPKGGQEELDSPSCPVASQIGRTLVGAGVGPTLSYAPGKIYLAGPYQGSKLSIVAITTAKVGPFDLGTVVIRQALKVDPETAVVSTDGAASEPIPHILQGIVVHARDIRIYVDRENFVLNPTSCERMTADATVLGSGLDFGSLADDQTAQVAAPFQAADCASLGFKPKLSLKLLGGTKRTDNPRLKAVLRARKGDANIGRAQVTLPRSTFLEQAHIRTVCTRVQFRAGGGNGEKCPKGSIYGRAKAISPLLDEPLSGPVFLRSSDNELPDLVAALHSPKVDINLVGRIDSLNGRIRNTFETVPDAPVTKFTLEMQGGRKGLIVNSTNLCKGKHRAIANFKGQNGRRHLFNPVVKAKCGKKGKKGGKGKR